jgi:hypothetical protein
MSFLLLGEIRENYELSINALQYYQEDLPSVLSSSLYEDHSKTQK